MMQGGLGFGMGMAMANMYGQQAQGMYGPPQGGPPQGGPLQGGPATQGPMPLGGQTAPTIASGASGNLAICTQCGARVPPGKFCAECGAAMGPPQPKPCTGCSQMNPPGAKFCANCGTRVPV
jgi:ribosomal protein L40E